MKKSNRKKKPIKLIKIFKKINWFGFGFISLKPKKLNWTQTEKKTDPNQFEPVFVLKNQIETGQFKPVSI